MKLRKEDYMRLSKERLAELLAERDNEVIQPISIPTSPSTTPYIPYEPWKAWPDITYADSPNTNETKGDDNLHTYLEAKK